MPTTQKENSKETLVSCAIERAVASANRHDHAGAIRILLPWTKPKTLSATVSGLLGSAYFEKGEFARAAEWFMKTTQLSPASELASLGLFHSLWNLDDASAAFDEMQRFLSDHTSDEYQTLLRDLAVEGRLEAKTGSAAVA